MKVPFVDLKSQYISIKQEIDDAINDVIADTAFIGGKFVRKFEEEFEQIYNVKNCISVANGTDSLYIIMKMLGIGKGDEVITSAYSWISSSETISQTGAKPIFVDIDDFFTIDSAQIESKITPKTKAILPIHIHGQMCDMDKIMEIANRNNVYVIEDCAQSHFSEFHSKRAGTFGIAGSFSFYPGKNLGAYGDAGCIITNDDEFAKKCKIYARHGALIKHQHIIEGINSRLDGIQAAILSAKLPHILKWTSQRIKNSELYTQKLKNISEIQCPQTKENTKHSHHLYVIKAQKRNNLMDFLKTKSIETAIHYPLALHNLEAYKYLKHKPTDFKIANNNQKNILSLPMFPELTEEEIDYVVLSIREFYEKK